MIVESTKCCSVQRNATRLFSEFEQQVSQISSDETFKSRFDELSHSADRAGMIDSLLKIPAIANFTVTDSYRAKEESRSEKILKQIRKARDNLAIIDIAKTNFILTEALLSAPWASKVFLEILALRARAWYSVGNLERCVKECRLFADSLSEYLSMNNEDESLEECRIDVLLIESDCCKARGVHEDAKNHLNEAMRRISGMAWRQCDDDNKDEASECFKSKKLELFKGFLQRKLQKLPTQRLQADNATCQSAKQIATVDGKTNDFLSCCTDALALGIDETKGRFLYATRNIKPGSVLIVDQPFSFSTDLNALHRNCLNCHVSLRLENSIRIPCKNCQSVQFCSEECRQQAWDKFHKYECRIFDYFFETNFQKTNSFLAYRTVVAAFLHVQDNSLEFDQEFLQLHKNDKDILNVQTLTKYEPHDYKTVFSLETHCIHTDPKVNLERAILSIFLAKCLICSLNYYHPEVNDHERHLQVLAVALLHNMQTINCNAYEIVENVRDDETKILEPRNVGGAIYTSVSLTNHSCYPNVIRHTFPCGTVVVKSLRFIPQGSEILDCYGQHFLENKRDSRQKQLAQKYYFECQCVACSFDWPITLPSDKFNFKCKKCFNECRRTRSAAECTTCGHKTEISKLYALLQNSIKKRLTALTKMYEGLYQDALPLLLEHANCIDKILSEPSLEAVKTQQSIIQCLNALSSTSI